MAASSTSKLLMSDEEMEDKENRSEYASPKDPVAFEMMNRGSIFGEFLDNTTREGKSGCWTRVKAPMVEQHIRLPKIETYPHQHARLFTKEAGSSEGFIHSIGCQRGSQYVPLIPLCDYTVLHVRKDGWAMFLRGTDLSIFVFKVVDPRPQNLIPTPPILGIEKGRVLSGNLVGGTALGNLEIFMIGTGVVENQNCGLLFHLGRGESSWTITRFPSNVPTKAVGPMLLEGGVLITILDGTDLVTVDLHDYSAGRSVLGGFRRMGNSTLVRGRSGNIFAIQIAGIPGPPVVREIESGDGWLMPTITHFEEPMQGRFFLTKNDIGFILAGGSSCYANCMADRHIWVYVNGAWQGLDAHRGCSCSGGFMD